MLFGHVMIEPVAAVADLGAILAGVGVGAGEVDVLHMLAQVGAVGAQLAANGAAVGPRPPLGMLLDKTVQLAIRI